MRGTLLILALATSACSTSQLTNNTAIEPAKVANGYALRSNVSGYSLVRLAELPLVTAMPDDPGINCAQPQQPVSAGAKAAAQKGWRVLQEEPFHQFQAVLIARGGNPLTSGRCSTVDSNIAFFDGDRLIGILYPKGKDAAPIASMEKVGGHLRLWSTDPGALGQASLKGSDLTFDTITGDDLVCNDRLRVPAVFELRYSQARQKLIAAGWSARSSAEDVQDYRTADYRKRFPETDSCAGTGYAECRFSLVAKNGAVLLVTTMGEDDDPVVSTYEAQCNGKPAAN